MLCFASAYRYLRKNLAGINSMSSLQAILIAFKEVVAHSL